MVRDESTSLMKEKRRATEPTVRHVTMQGPVLLPD